jgi:enediyne biosynthesis protein E5
VNAITQQLNRINPWRAMLVYMMILALYGVYALGDALGALRILAVAVPVGVGLDYYLHKIGGSSPKFGAFPQSGLISSLIVSVLMPIGVNPLVVVAAVAAAVGSKHYIRFAGAHLFNPAAFGVTVTALLFRHPLGWWPDSYFWLVILLGAVNVWRVRKQWQVLGFLVIYAVLLTVVVGVNITGLGSIPLFFALFMLPEPVTSKPGKKRELIFGVIVAVTAIICTVIPLLAPVALTLGLLAGNASRFVHKA